MDNQFSQSYMSYGQSQQQPQSHQQQHPGSYGNLSSQGQQQQDSPSHQTLPPLQSQNPGYAQFGSLSYAHPGSQSHTPTTPHAPVSSSMGNGSTNAYSHISPASAMGPPGYPNYSMSSSMMYPSSTSTSMPSTTSASGLPNIRPMPPGGVSGPMNGLPSLATAQLGQQPSFLQNEEAPTHVVGSQGRRGILPSAPGRPNAPVTTGGQTTKNMIPQKDADGKYPCPHCNKTYLHAKHLKRHLLRHTGDRPYSCHLCKDTFSRSDILKRHFQKCSIRRGNPTGANHLAHQRRNQNSNRLSISQQDGPIGLAGLSEVAGANPYNPGVAGSSPTVNGDASGRTSRANSLINPGSMSHRNSIAGLGILGSNGAPGSEQMGSSQGYQPNLHAYALQNSTNGGPMQPGYAFNHPHMNGAMYSSQQQQQQPMSFLGQQSSRFDHSHTNSPLQQTHSGEGNSAPHMDWSRMFTQGGQDGFIGGSLSANAGSQGIIKPEPDTKPFNDSSNDSFLGSLYSHPGGFGGEDADNEHGIPGFPNWSVDDPLQAKVDSLMQYSFPENGEAAQSNPEAAEMVKMCLSVENVKHFAEHYTSFHGHWPIIHMPTFKLTDAGNALVLAIICIGAIYSPRMNVSQSRQMMEFVRATVFKNSTIYQRVVTNQTQGLGNSSTEVDELQALLIISTMYTWHGTPELRDISCNDMPVIVRVARAMGLLQTAPPGHYAYSVLHHTSNRNLSQEEWAGWNWQGWLEQEKRNRAVYHLFLTDAAVGMYFNSTPQLDPLEIRLPLPADDAAWDAKDQDECASALGLRGHDAQSKNATGTRNMRQPGMRESVRALLELNANFPHNTTNAFSKFVLIHALIMRIMACQKVLFQPDGTFQGFNAGFGGSGPATPLSQNEWLDQHAGGAVSNNNSGHATPTDGFGPSVQNVQAQQEKKRLNYALDKWKRMWDTDMEIQYQPGQSHLRRFGFSRDGVHFFYLGRSFIQSNKPTDWTASPNVRFTQVMGLLKRIKQFVVGDPSHYGHDIGSVGDIDDKYGLDNLSLDMKLLFKPYNVQLHGAVPGVQTHAL